MDYRGSDHSSGGGGGGNGGGSGRGDSRLSTISDLSGLSFTSQESPKGNYSRGGNIGTPTGTGTTVNVNNSNNPLRSSATHIPTSPQQQQQLQLQRNSSSHHHTPVPANGSSLFLSNWDDGDEISELDYSASNHDDIKDMSTRSGGSSIGPAAGGGGAGGVNTNNANNTNTNANANANANNNTMSSQEKVLMVENEKLKRQVELYKIQLIDVRDEYDTTRTTLQSRIYSLERELREVAVFHHSRRLEGVSIENSIALQKELREWQSTNQDVIEIAQASSMVSTSSSTNETSVPLNPMMTMATTTAQPPHITSLVDAPSSASAEIPEVTTSETVSVSVPEADVEVETSAAESAAEASEAVSAAAASSESTSAATKAALLLIPQLRKQVKELQEEVYRHEQREVRLEQELQETREAANTAQRLLSESNKRIQWLEEDSQQAALSARDLSLADTTTINDNGNNNNNNNSSSNIITTIDDRGTDMLRKQRGDQQRQINRLLEENGQLRMERTTFFHQKQQQNMSMEKLKKTLEQTMQDNKMEEIVLYRQLIEWKKRAETYENKFLLLSERTASQRTINMGNTSTSAATTTTPAPAPADHGTEGRLRALEIQNRELLEQQERDRILISSLEEQLDDATAENRRTFLPLNEDEENAAHEVLKSFEDEDDDDENENDHTEGESDNNAARKTSKKDDADTQKLSLYQNGGNTPSDTYLVDRIKRYQEELQASRVREEAMSIQIQELTKAVEIAQENAAELLQSHFESSTTISHSNHNQNSSNSAGDAGDDDDIIRTEIMESTSMMTTSTTTTTPTATTATATATARRRTNNDDEKNFGSFQKRLEYEKVQLASRQKARIQKVKDLEQSFVDIARETSFSFDDGQSFRSSTIYDYNDTTASGHGPATAAAAATDDTNDTAGEEMVGGPSSSTTVNQKDPAAFSSLHQRFEEERKLLSARQKARIQKVKEIEQSFPTSPDVSRRSTRTVDSRIVRSPHDGGVVESGESSQTGTPTTGTTTTTTTTTATNPALKNRLDELARKKDELARKKEKVRRAKEFRRSLADVVNENFDDGETTEGGGENDDDDADEKTRTTRITTGATTTTTADEGNAERSVKLAPRLSPPDTADPVKATRVAATTPTTLNTDVVEGRKVDLAEQLFSEREAISAPTSTTLTKQSYRRHLEEARLHISQLEASVRDLGTKLAQSEERNKNEEDRIMKLRNELDTRKGEIQKYKADALVTKRQLLGALKAQETSSAKLGLGIDKMNETKMQLVTENERLSKELTAAREGVQLKEAYIDSQADEMTEASQELKTEADDDDNDSSGAEMSLRDELEMTKNNERQLEVQLENKKNEIELCHDNIEKLEGQLRMRQNELQLQSDLFGKLQGEMNTMKENWNSLESQVQVEKRARETAELSLVGSRHDHNELMNNLTEVEDEAMELREQLEHVQEEWQSLLDGKVELEEELATVKEEYNELSKQVQTSSSSSSSSHGNSNDDDFILLHDDLEFLTGTMMESLDEEMEYDNDMKYLESSFLSNMIYQRERNFLLRLKKKAKSQSSSSASSSSSVSAPSRRTLLDERYKATDAVYTTEIAGLRRQLRNISKRKLVTFDDTVKSSSSLPETTTTSSSSSSSSTLALKKKNDELMKEIEVKNRRLEAVAGHLSEMESTLLSYQDDLEDTEKRAEESELRAKAMEVRYKESMSELEKAHDAFERLRSKSDEWRQGSTKLKDENVKLDGELKQARDVNYRQRKMLEGAAIQMNEMEANYNNSQDELESAELRIKALEGTLELFGIQKERLGQRDDLSLPQSLPNPAPVQHQQQQQQQQQQRNRQGQNKNRSPNKKKNNGSSGGGGGPAKQKRGTPAPFHWADVEDEDDEEENNDNVNNMNAYDNHSTEINTIRQQTDAQIKKLKAEYDDVKESLRNARSEITSLKSQKGQLEKKNETLANDLNIKDGEVDKFQRRLEGAASQMNDLEESLLSTQDELTQAESTIQHLEVTIQQLQSRIQGLDAAASAAAAFSMARTTTTTSRGGIALFGGNNHTDEQNDDDDEEEESYARTDKKRRRTETSPFETAQNDHGAGAGPGNDVQNVSSMNRGLTGMPLAQPQDDIGAVAEQQRATQARCDRLEEEKEQLLDELYLLEDGQQLQLDFVATISSVGAASTYHAFTLRQIVDDNVNTFGNGLVSEDTFKEHFSHLQKLEEDHKTLLGKVEELEEEVDIAKDERDDLTSQYRKQQRKLENTASELKVMEASLLSCQEDLDASRFRVKVLQGQIRQLETNNTELVEDNERMSVLNQSLKELSSDSMSRAFSLPSLESLPEDSFVVDMSRPRDIHTQSDHENELREARRSISALESKSERLKKQVDRLKEQNHHLSRELSMAKEKAKTLRYEASDMSMQLKDSRVREEAALHEVHKCEQSLSWFKDDASRRHLDIQLTLDATQQQLTDARNYIMDLTSDLEAANSKKAELETALVSMSGALASAGTEASDLNKELQELKSKMGEVEASKEDLHQQLELRQDEDRMQQDLISKLSTQLSQTVAREQSLTDELEKIKEKSHESQEDARQVTPENSPKDRGIQKLTATPPMQDSVEKSAEEGNESEMVNKESLESRVKDLEASLEDEKQKVITIDKEKSDLILELEQLKHDSKKLSDQIAALTGEKESLSKDMNDLRVELSGVRRKYDELQVSEAQLRKDHESEKTSLIEEKENVLSINGRLQLELAEECRQTAALKDSERRVLEEKAVVDNELREVKENLALMQKKEVGYKDSINLLESYKSRCEGAEERLRLIQRQLHDSLEQERSLESRSKELKSELTSLQEANDPSCKESLDSEIAKSTELRNEIEKLNAAVVDFREKNEKISGECKTLHAQVDQLSADKVALECDLALVTGERDALMASNRGQSLEIDNLVEANGDLKRSLLIIEDRLAKKVESAEVLNTELEEELRKSEKVIEKLQGDVQGTKHLLQAELDESLKREEQLVADLELCTGQMETYMTEHERMEGELKGMGKQLEEKVEETKTLESEKDSLSEQLQKLEAEIDKLQEEKETYQERDKKLGNDLGSFWGWK